jgi:hypothetical protein
MDDFDLLDWIVNAKPVAFEVDGVGFVLRQPSPVEMDRLRFAKTLAYDRAIAEYKADGLDEEPVTDGLTETRRLYLDALEADYQRANADNDGEAARRAAEEMEAVRGTWPKSLAEERARDHARRVTARWMLDNLLQGDRDELRRLGAPDPLNRQEVIAAVQHMLSIINHDPNSNRRTQ